MSETALYLKLHTSSLETLDYFYLQPKFIIASWKKIFEDIIKFKFLKVIHVFVCSDKDRFKYLCLPQKVLLSKDSVSTQMFTDFPQP